MTVSTVIWRSRAEAEPWTSEHSLAELASLTLAQGGHAALRAWTAARDEAASRSRTRPATGAPATAPAALRALASSDEAIRPQAPSLSLADSIAYVHGERHDLWWEFTLEASFRWQAHLCRLRPDVYQSRLRRLTRALGLEEVLQREVASLTHGTRALADLAVALLQEPRLLLWEEPFYYMSHGEALRAVRLVEAEHLAGMAVVAVARETPGLIDLPAEPRRPSLRRGCAAR